MIFIPFLLHYVTLTIPEPDLSSIHRPHPFQHIDDRVFFIGLVLNFGIYLYPLHIIFINKSTIQIQKSLFLFISILDIMVFPLYSMFIGFPARDYIIVIIYTLLIFVLPFLIFYYIKYKLYKKGA